MKKPVTFDEGNAKETYRTFLHYGAKGAYYEAYCLLLECPALLGYIPLSQIHYHHRSILKNVGKQQAEDFQRMMIECMRGIEALLCIETLPNNANTHVSRDKEDTAGFLDWVAARHGPQVRNACEQALEQKALWGEEINHFETLNETIGTVKSSPISFIQFNS